MIVHHRNLNSSHEPGATPKRTEEHIVLIDNKIVDCILQPFVTRLLDMKKQLFNQENLVNEKYFKNLTQGIL